MKVQLVSATVLTGVSVKKNPNGTPYEIAAIKYLKPLQPFKNNKGTEWSELKGFGFEVKEMQLKPEAVASFEKVSFGKEVELLLEPHPRFDDRLWCVGVK